MTHAHAHTHTYMCVCVCACARGSIHITYLLHGAESFLRS